jgi:hypothetical protein
MPPRSNKKKTGIMLLIIIILILIVVLYVVYNKTRINVYAGIDATAGQAKQAQARAGRAQAQQAQAQQAQAQQAQARIASISADYSGRGEDVFLDIYKAPLRDDNCMIPINVPTQSCGDAPYRQVGILTTQGQGMGTQGTGTILPLMGRPLFKRRDKWNFYTLNDKNNMIKLPVKVNGRSGTDEIGCDNVYTGDLVFVEGYQEKFKFTAYDNQVMRYLPTNL